MAHLARRDSFAIARNQSYVHEKAMVAHGAWHKDEPASLLLYTYAIMFPSTLRLALFSSLLVAACGGVAIERSNEGDAGTGGAAANGGHPSGAAPSTGGKVGGGAVTGAGGKVGAGGVPGAGGFVGKGGAIGVAGGPCCNAKAVCKPGDTEVASPFFCPPGTSCYEVSMCCQNILCRSDPTCTGVAPCYPGEIQLGDNASCPNGGTCYLHLVCGKPVTCFVPFQDAGTPACSGTPPRGVHYVSTSLEKCKLIDYACPAGTMGYSDQCGCGCVQSASCPDYVNCAPMIPPAPTNPLCADSTKCPYSVRAL
jgi:hypothetical protein